MNERRSNLRNVVLASALSGAIAVAGCQSTDQSGSKPAPPQPNGNPSDQTVVNAWRSGEGEPLFDGATLRGWVQRGGKAQYRVEEGVIVGTTVPHTPNSFLCTEKTYGDFELTLDFKVDPRVNSGVQFRSLSTPEYQNGRVHGYQAEIDPSERAWTGGLYDEGRRNWLVNLEGNPEGRKAFRQNDWNTMKIRAVGDTISIWINGVPTVREFRDSRTAEGFIALQVHDVGKNETPMEVRWRNIRLTRVASK